MNLMLLFEMELGSLFHLLLCRILLDLDVNNVFLQCQISKDVYMAQPSGFVDRDNPTHVCKLKKAIYGLKQFLIEHYIFDLLAWTKMFGTKPIATPLVIDGNLILHLNADWAGNKDDYTSTSAYILGITLPTLHVIYCDNVGVTYLCSNPVFHWCMKHVAIDYHFIRDQVQSSALRVTHVSSADQLANALTKPLPRSRFQELQIKIGVFSGTPS
ncbi:hypothetical protein AAG906_013336 [Vitis piasezkii]